MPLFSGVTIIGAPDDNFHNLAEVTSGEDTDELLIWDVSAGGYRKIQRQNLIKLLSIPGVISPDYVEHVGAAVPSNPAAGRKRVFLTMAGVLEIVDDVGTVQDFIFEDDIQTMTHKTLTTPVLTTPHADTPVIDGYCDINEEASPATPGSGVGRIFYKSDHKAYLKDDLGSERAFALGNQSGINYILNPDAEGGTTGWATYNDGAAADPVDGTGGTATGVTWTRNTTTPLRGSGDFKLTKDAANRQGKGASYDFAIDLADETNVLRVSFDWLSNVTLDEGDIRVWLYDVSNAVLIQPVPYKLPSTVAAVKNHWMGEFQTAYNSLSYRLIIHIASTSAVAWNIEFENFSLGPQPAKQGVPATDPVDFTPTGTWVANVTYYGSYSRIGVYAEITMVVQCSGAPTATPLSFTLPSYLTVDVAKLADNGAVNIAIGSAEIRDAGARHYPGICYVTAGSPNNISVVCAETTGDGSSAVTEDNPFAFGNTDYVSVSVIVPILGWGSNCQVSSDAETRVVSAFYERNTDLALGGGALVTFVCNLKKWDTHNAYDTATGIFTVPIAGFYRVNYHVRVKSTAWTAGDELSGGAVKNAETEIKMNAKVFDANVTSMSLAGGLAPPIYCEAGDTLKVQLYNNRGTTVDGSVPQANYVGFERISGPSQIAASEKVYALYSSNSGQNIVNNTDTVVNFEDKTYDSHGSVTVGAGWKFTSPKAAIYRVTAFLILNEIAGSFNGTTESFQIKLYKNGGGTPEKVLAVIVPASTSTYPALNGTGSLYLLAGDYIQIEAYQNCGLDKNLVTNAYQVWVEIVEV